MKTKIQRLGGMAVVAASLLLTLSGPSEAFCLKDCQTRRQVARQDNAQSGSIRNQGPSTNFQNNQADQRYNSHNFGDTSTNVMGDMNIQVGHEKVEIKGMENSTNSMIDASISSTIILGNVKQ